LLATPSADRSLADLLRIKILFRRSDGETSEFSSTSTSASTRNNLSFRARARRRARARSVSAASRYTLNAPASISSADSYPPVSSPMQSYLFLLKCLGGYHRCAGIVIPWNCLAFVHREALPSCDVSFSPRRAACNSAVRSARRLRQINPLNSALRRTPATFRK
jgi:hypothetical protein